MTMWFGRVDTMSGVSCENAKPNGGRAVGLREVFVICSVHLVLGSRVVCTRTQSVGAVDLGDLKADTAERLSRDAAAAALPRTHRSVHSSLSLSPVTYCHTGAAACVPPPLRPPRSTLVSAAHVTTVAQSWPSARAADCLHRWRRRRARGPTSGSPMPPSRPRRGFRRSHFQCLERAWGYFPSAREDRRIPRDGHSTTGTTRVCSVGSRLYRSVGWKEYNNNNNVRQKLINNIINRTRYTIIMWI